MCAIKLYIITTELAFIKKKKYYIEVFQQCSKDFCNSFNYGYGVNGPLRVKFDQMVCKIGWLIVSRNPIETVEYCTADELAKCRPNIIKLRMGMRAALSSCCRIIDGWASLELGERWTIRNTCTVEISAYNASGP